MLALCDGNVIEGEETVADEEQLVTVEVLLFDNKLVVISDWQRVAGAEEVKLSENAGVQRSSSSLLSQAVFSKSSLLQSQKYNLQYGLSKSALYFSTVNGIDVPGRNRTSDISEYNNT